MLNSVNIKKEVCLVDKFNSLKLYKQSLRIYKSSLKLYEYSLKL